MMTAPAEARDLNINNNIEMKKLDQKLVEKFLLGEASKYGSAEEAPPPISPFDAYTGEDPTDFEQATLDRSKGDKVEEVKTGSIKLSYKTVEQALWNAFETSEDKPEKNTMLIWGLPGIGKSEILKQFGKKVKRKHFNDRNTISATIKGKVQAIEGDEKSKDVIIFNNLPTWAEKETVMENLKDYFWIFDVRSASMLVENITGLPMVGNKKEYEVNTTPIWVHMVTNPDAAGILLLDEINQANPDVCKIMYQILWDRVIGEHPMSPNVFVCGAGNLGDMFEELTTDMTPAATNRCKIGTLVADPELWFRYATTINEKTGKTYVDQFIVDYVKTDPKKTFLVMPRKYSGGKFGKGANQHGWPSPRSIVQYSQTFRMITSRFNNDLASATTTEEKKKLSSEWVNEVIREAGLFCGYDWATGLKEYLQKTSKPAFNRVSLFNIDFSQLNMADELAWEKYILNQLIVLGDEVIGDGNGKGIIQNSSPPSTYEDMFEKVLKKSAELSLEKLTTLLCDLKAKDESLGAAIIASYTALNDTHVDEAIAAATRIGINKTP